MHWGNIQFIQALVGMPCGKRPHERLGYRRKGNINMALKEIRYECVDQICLKEQQRAL
jgi:hypothetical protein